MLLAHAARINARRVVLASQSPRRSDILRQLGIEFSVVPSAFKEDLDKSTFASPAAYVEETARQKALDVFHRVACDGAGAPLVIAADTVVVSPDGTILEKPADAADACRMLGTLSGNTHIVVSGVALIVPQSPPPAAGSDSHAVLAGSTVVVFHEATEVTFGELTAEAIEAYARTGEPLDKAGAYGIQGQGGSFVAEVRGCYYNVVGLPAHGLCKHLLRALAP